MCETSATATFDFVERAQRRGAPALGFDDRPLAEDRARPDLAQHLAVDFDREHTVEQQEQLGAELALLHQELRLP